MRLRLSCDSLSLLQSNSTWVPRASASASASSSSLGGLKSSIHPQSQSQSHPHPRLFSHSIPFRMAPTPVLLSPEQIQKSNIKLESHEAAFREGSATIVLPSKEAAFLNPVQEFNRDISTLAIRTWSERRDQAKRLKWEQKQEKIRAKNSVEGKERKGNKRPKVHQPESEVEVMETEAESTHPADASALNSSSSNPQPKWRPEKFTLFEALAATGLRSIRYANEIPLVKRILANDLSPTAVEAMRRNVALNFPATGEPIKEWTPERETADQVSTGEGTSDERDPKGSHLNPNGDLKIEVDEDEIMEMENKAAQSSSKSNSSSLQNEAAAIDQVKTEKTSEKQNQETSQDAEKSQTSSATIHPKCKIEISQQDATSVLYSHRDPSDRFDVIDLDPYGSAVPFLDGAVQSIAENGLLCVTCTDLAVLAGHNYPEKAYSAYGGVSGKAEYVHEIALRLLLHSIEMAGARYGRTIKPLLSLSIDFYVRIFLIVQSSPKEVKNVASRNGVVYLCSGCGDFRTQRFGKAQQIDNEGKEGKVNSNIKYSSAMAEAIPSNCPECRSRYHVAGPLYLGPLHDKSFCDNMVEILERNPKRFGTAGRIRGMVGLAADELDTLFYFTPTKFAGTFHCTCPSMSSVISAILHAGYSASRSHCAAGSIKTSAPRSFIYDLFRRFIRLPGNQVKMDKISETSPSYHLNMKEPVHEAMIGPEVEEHKDTKKVLNGTITPSGGKGVAGTRYQMNPLPNWGPGTAAKGHTGKRKRELGSEPKGKEGKEGE